MSAVGELDSGVGGSHDEEEEGRVEEDVLGEDQRAGLCMRVWERFERKV